ncbi:pilus assembly FimT family protein [Ferroacidibacillus organovorans]|nr:type II secretion system protein [Ferroacidibacillus organovorans]
MGDKFSGIGDDGKNFFKTTFYQVIHKMRLLQCRAVEMFQRGMTLLELLAALVISTLILGVILFIFSFEISSFNTVISRQHVYTSLDLVESQLQQFVQNMTSGSAHVSAVGVLQGTNVYGENVELRMTRLTNGQVTFQESEFTSSGTRIKRVTWNTPFVSFANSSITVQNNIIRFHLDVTAMDTPVVFRAVQNVQYVAGGGY